MERAKKAGYNIFIILLEREGVGERERKKERDRGREREGEGEGEGEVRGREVPKRYIDSCKNYYWSSILKVGGRDACER